MKAFSRELDFENPIDIFEKLRGKNSFLLHSPKVGSQSRYSFAGSEPYLVFRSKDRKIETDGQISEGNPITELRKLVKKIKVKHSKNLPPFQCGAVGYFGYDIVHFFEKLPREAVDDLNLPDCCFAFYDKTVAFDHLKKKMYLIAVAENKKDGNIKLDELQSRLNRKTETKNSEIKLLSGIKSNFTKDEYIKAVKKVKDYIFAGDTFQVNISQRFSADVGAEPFEVYKKLVRINPSPFSAFLDFEGVKLISCSPERLVKLSEGKVEARPIAGTRKRGKTAEEDAQLERELLTNEKELAEHIMLVDLARNDLGRVCEYGSVKVNEKLIVERYSHVMHLVSNVVGKLHKNKDAFDLLRAVFPGGTITGCPKVRTMEIIDEIELVRRGPYTGAIGYFGFSGDADMNMIIRTFVANGKKYYMQAGGGIVADSNPEKEYEETIHKARALFEAIGGKTNVNRD